MTIAWSKAFSSSSKTPTLSALLVCLLPEGLLFLAPNPVEKSAFIHILAVALGSGIGGVMRYAVSLAIAARMGEGFPWGTLIVNVTGSYLIGLIAALSGPDSPYSVPTALRLFLMVGILGGFTTFSSFSLQTLQLLHNRAWLGFATAGPLLRRSP